MADGEILYIVKADNKQAVDALDKVMKSFDGITQKTKGLTSSTQNSTMQLQSLSRVVQDLPFGFMAIGNNLTFMAEQMAYAKSQGVSMGAQLKGMLGSMLGTGGVVFAISLLTSGLTYLSMQSSKTNKNIEDFADVLDRAKKGTKELKTEIEKLSQELEDKLSPNIIQYLLSGGDLASAMTGNIPGAAGTINKQRELYNLQDKQNKLIELATSLTSNYGKSLGEVVKQNMLRREDLKFMQNYLDKELDKIPLVSSYYKQYASALEAVGNALGKVKKEIDRSTVSGVPDALGVQNILSSKPPRAGSRFGMKEVKGVAPVNLALNEEVRMIIEENRMLIDTVVAGADTMRGAFIDAWRDIFGEANSLFEQLMANILAAITANLSTSLAGGFLNMIVPGLGTALGMGDIFGKTTQVVNVNLGDEPLARVVVKGQEQAQRLRLL